MATNVPSLKHEDTLNLPTICEELCTARHKSYQIGIKLHIPYHKLEEFRKAEDPLAAVVNYWLSGNVEGVPVSWQFIVTALKSDYVGETGLAQRISSKHCSEEIISEEGDSKYEESVITTVTSNSSGSTFKLPAIDLTSYFPYFRDKTVSEEKLQTLELKLDKSTTKLKRAFAYFVVSLQRHIEETTTTEHIVTALKVFDKKFGELLTDCSKLIDVFSKITPYFSFFDFDIIKFLTKNFGSRSNQQKLKKYKKMFAKFAEQRIFECPEDAFGDAGESEKCFVMKIDRQIDEMTVNDLQKFKFEISETLNCTLRLLKVKRGCVQLVFRVKNFNEIINSITTEQKNKLSELKVLSISYDETKITISSISKMVKVSELQHSDSGVYSGKFSGHSECASSYLRSQHTGSTTRSRSAILICKAKDLSDSRIDMIIAAESEPKTLPFFSPLYDAIGKGNLHRVKELIEAGENPMEEDVNGNSCLHYAATLQQLEILKYLIEEVELPPGTEGWNGKNILHMASGLQHLSMVKYLVEAERCRLDPTITDKSNNSVIYYACCGGNLEIVRYLIECVTKEYMRLDDILYYYSDLPSNRIMNVNKFTRNPMCCACYHGHLPIVKYFVEECGYESTQLYEDMHPFESAVSGKQLCIVKYLAIKHILGPNDKVALLAVQSNLSIIKYLAETLQYDFSCQVDGDTPLFIACYLGKMDIVRYFLKILQHNVAAKGANSCQPIHAAAIAGHLEILKYLVQECSCEVTALTDRGETPLHLASSYGHLSVVKYLISEQQCDPLASFSEECGSSFEQASAAGQVEVARYIASNWKPDPAVNDECLTTSLLVAACNGQLKFVKFLVEELGCKHKAKDKTGNNVLHYSVYGGNISLFKYLTKQLICDVNDVNQAGMNIVLLAAHCGKLELLKYFIEDLKMDSKVTSSLFKAKNLICLPIDDQQKLNEYMKHSYFYFLEFMKPTPFWHAILKNHQDIIKYYIEQLHYDINDNELFLAVGIGNLEIVNYLMTNISCDLMSNDLLITLLHWAAFSGSTEVFFYLIEKYDCLHLSVMDEYCTMPIHCAAGGGNLDLLTVLVKGNCDINARDIGGKQPIHLAAMWGHLDVAKYLVAELKCDPNASTKVGEKPIHLASRHGHFSIVKYLVEEIKCDPATKEQFLNFTPLHYASVGGHVHIVQYLIEKEKIDPFCRTLVGHTPLHAAAFSGDLDVMKFLAKEYSECMLMVDNDNRTPLDYALFYNCDSVALFLITAMFKLL